MKPLIILVLMGTFLAHSNAQYAMELTTYPTMSTIFPSKFFFLIQWGKKLDQFILRFHWKNGVTINYQQKKYLITRGQILYDFNQKKGLLQLLSENENKTERIELSNDLTESEFTQFATIYNDIILKPAFSEGQDTSILIANNLKGKPLDEYKAIKKLLQDTFPGLTIEVKKSSWFNWPTITWRHIVGAIGLGAAGYAYYKYYNAR